MEVYKERFFTLYFQGCSLVAVCIMILVLAVKGAAGLLLMAPLSLPLIVIGSIVPVMDLSRMIRDINDTKKSSKRLMSYGLAVLLGAITAGIYYTVYLYMVNRRINELLHSKDNDNYLPPLLFAMFPLTLGAGGVIAHGLIIKKYKKLAVRTAKRSQMSESSESYVNSRCGILKCIMGDLKGAEILLYDRESVIIGRDPANANILLSDPRVSRIHCKVTYYEGSERFSIINYSSNGIIIGGKRLREFGEEYIFERNKEMKISPQDVFILK